MFFQRYSCQEIVPEEILGILDTNAKEEISNQTGRKETRWCDNLSMVYFYDLAALTMSFRVCQHARD